MGFYSVIESNLSTEWSNLLLNWVISFSSDKGYHNFYLFIKNQTQIRNRFRFPEITFSFQLTNPFHLLRCWLIIIPIRSWSSVLVTPVVKQHWHQHEWAQKHCWLPFHGKPLRKCPAIRRSGVSAKAIWSRKSTLSVARWGRLRMQPGFSSGC